MGVRVSRCQHRRQPAPRPPSPRRAPDVPGVALGLGQQRTHQLNSGGVKSVRHKLSSLGAGGAVAAAAGRDPQQLAALRQSALHRLERATVGGLVGGTVRGARGRREGCLQLPHGQQAAAAWRLTAAAVPGQVPHAAAATCVPVLRTIFSAFNSGISSRCFLECTQKRLRPG